jgi:hypothetical protein
LQIAPERICDALERANAEAGAAGLKLGDCWLRAAKALG